MKSRANDVTIPSTSRQPAVGGGLSIEAMSDSMSAVDELNYDLIDKTNGDSESFDDTPWVPVLYYLEATQSDGSVKKFYQDSPFNGVEFMPSKPVHIDGLSEKASAIQVKAEVTSSDLDEAQEQTIRSWSTQQRLDPNRRINVDMIEGQKISIHSQRLLSVLESAIDYDPQHSTGMSQHSLDSRGCYQSLLLHYDTLYDLYASKMKLNLRHKESEEQYVDEPFKTISFDYGVSRLSLFWDDFCKSDMTSDAWDSQTTSEVAALLSLIYPHYRDKVTPVVQKLKGLSPKIEFENLWMLYKPGTLVYRVAGDEINALVVSSVQRVQKDERPLDSDISITKVIYEIEAWRFDWDVEKLVRRSTVAHISAFGGDCSCLSLPLIPALLLEKARRCNPKTKLRDRGIKYIGLLDAPFAHRGYKHTGSLYEGQIIVDPVEYSHMGDGPYIDELSGLGTSHALGEREDSEFYITKVLQLPSGVPMDSGGSKRFVKYAEIDLSNNEQKGWLLQHGVLLLPSRIGGLALALKKWKRFNVDGIVEVAPGDQREHLKESLVLADDDKELLANVVRRRAKGHSTQADFIPGKGEGQVFLLYGPSGTGKTLTAECVANDTGRPLLSLLKHDLIRGYGYAAEDESLLRLWFNLAAKWGAILLIDEADILLEKRTAAGTHNHLVTVFLRSMEYYAGILFLTTNRPGKIDDAFISRVTAPIEYPKFGQTERNMVWQKFFDLHEKHSSTRIRITQRAKDELRKDTTDINGREIRNIFLTAINLARAEQENRNAPATDDIQEPEILYVEPHHFQKPLERHKRFKQYIQQVHDDMDEVERNRREGNY